jgi:hypothetical protein
MPPGTPTGTTIRRCTTGTHVSMRNRYVLIRNNWPFISPLSSHSNLEQALYTPLVSPAMTPLESQFRLPEYTIPGEYFTPLTSPALEAQNSNSSNDAYAYHARQVSDVGFVPSSAEVNFLPGSSMPPSPSIIRKTNRRRGSTAASSRIPGGRSKVKQSPSLRAQNQRTKGKSTPTSEEFYNSLQHEMARPQNHDVRSLQVSSTEGSGQDSVSPEPLSEPLMPPPALPAPRRSPVMTAQPPQSPGTAATPAPLMRIQRSQHALESSGQFGGAQLESHDELMEDISLPEAAAPALQPRPQVNRIDTSIRMSASSTSASSPAISAKFTPMLDPRSAATDRTGSIALSPRTMAMPSPSGPVPKRSDPSRSSISSRKRPSVSSTHASPQLRPKISPSIQPMIRSSDSKWHSLTPDKIKALTVPRRSDPRRNLPRLQIKLPAHSRRDITLRRLLPRNTRREPKLETHKPQTRRARASQPNQQRPQGNRGIDPAGICPGQTGQRGRFIRHQAE